MVGIKEGHEVLMRKLLFSLITLLAAAQSNATPVPIENLLERVEQDPAVLAAESAHQADLDRQAMRRSEAGARAFTSVSAGHYRELNSANLIDDYYARNATIGISYPLLGSLKRQLDVLKQAQLDAQRSQLAIALRRAEQRLVMRTTYADWWRYQQEASLCNTIEQAAKQRIEQLGNRRAAGWMRGSEASDAIQQWAALRTRCSLASSRQSELRSLLEMLAQLTLPSDATAVAPALHTQSASLAAWKQQIDGHPAIQEREAELTQAQEKKSPPWYASIESSISLGYSAEDRSGVSRYGNNIIAALNFSMPFDIGSHASAARGEAAHRLRAARDQLHAERRRLILEISTLLRTQQQNHETWITQGSVVKNAQQRLREQVARQELDTDQAVILIQNAQLNLFKAQFDLISTWHQLWVDQSALRLFIDDNPEATWLLGTKTIDWQPQNTDSTKARANTRKNGNTKSSAAAPPAWTMGAYVWNSEPLLKATTRDTELNNLIKAGFRRIYIGLSAAQINEIDALKHEVRALLDSANKRNIHVALLLGEPLWILPEHRSTLTALLEKLSDLPFAGLHLDLEVEQLGWPVPAARLTAWLNTLDQAKKISPWPLEISSHHRWFSTQFTQAVCVPCQLPEVGVQSVSLMIYTRSTQRSTSLTNEIAKRWPQLHFRLAQSIETELGTDESWFSASPSQIEHALSEWRTALAQRTIGGIDWQSWEYFQKHMAAQNKP